MSAAKASALLRLAALVLSIVGVFWGVSVMAGLPAAAVVTGGLIWFDLSRGTNEQRDSECSARPVRK